MLCQDTDSMGAIRIPERAVHVPREAIELAQALLPYIDAIQEMGQGNGDIIVPVRGNSVQDIRLDFKSKLRKIIRFSRK